MKLCEMILNWGKKMLLWLILCVSFSGLWDVQVYVPTSFRRVPLRVLLNEVSICINTKLSKLSHEHCPPQCEWASSIQLKTWIEQKVWVRGSFLHPDGLELGHWSLPAPGLTLKHHLFLDLKVDFQTGAPPSALVLWPQTLGPVSLQNRSESNPYLKHLSCLSFSPWLT